jgi:hypothetical protein
MNELIEKFAIDCAGQMVWNFPKDPEEFTFTRDELAKFAQLIVKECLTQVDKMRDTFEADGEDEQALGADWVGLAIARHFGVEL